MSGDSERDAPYQHPMKMDAFNIGSIKSKSELKRQFIQDPIHMAERYSALEKELKELKDEINRVWYLAYPESPIDTKDVAKMRVFNLYQDLKDTRFNYRVLHKAYNEMDKERKK